MPRIQQIALGLWITLVLTCLLFYVRNPAWLSPETVASALRESSPYVLSAYVALSILRSFTLLPSTVLVIAGTLLFPERVAFVFVISLLGVVLSSVLVYFFFEFLGLEQLFNRKYPERIRWLERQLQVRGIWIVMAWSAFPFVPTDLICYVAGTLKMNFTRFVLGVTFGELPLIGLYVVVGTDLSHALWG